MPLGVYTYSFNSSQIERPLSIEETALMWPKYIRCNVDTPTRQLCACTLLINLRFRPPLQIKNSGMRTLGQVKSVKNEHLK